MHHTIRPRAPCARLRLAFCLACAILATPRASHAQTCQPPALGAPCAQGGPALLPPAEPTLNLGAGNPIHLATGNKYQRELDLPASAQAPGLEIVRHYNALDPRRLALGRGWALSYDARLYRVGRTWQIVQADGSRILFAAPGGQPRANRHGRLHAQGPDWVWTWPNGKTLRFDAHGGLIRIRFVSGPRIDLQRHDAPGPLRGAIARITHSGGATLVPRYRIHGGHAYLSRIDSPLGPFQYQYETVPAQAGQTRAPSGLRLSGLVRPDGMQRRYLYEPGLQAGNPWAVTGIQIVSADGKHRKRITTWAYDQSGRAILAIQGPPSSAMGKVSIDYVQRPGPDSDGLTLVTNAQGGQTRFVTAMRGGRHVLRQADGAGCPGCPAPGSRAHYNRKGQLTGINQTRIDRDDSGAIKALHVTPAGWPALSLRYQSSGHRTAWHSSVTGTETMRFDPRHRPAQRRFANGDIWRYAYDAQGRPKRLEQTGAGETWTTRLSWRGRLLTRIAHPFENESREYDAGRRLAQRRVQRPGASGGAGYGYAESFDYDDRNRLVRHHLPEGGSLAYEWGPRGRLRSIDWIDARGVSHVVIASRPGLPGYRYGNGLTLATRAANGQASALIVSHEDTIVLAEARDYDAHGRLLQERHAAPGAHHQETWRYAYDRQSRMTGAQRVESGRAIWYAWRPDGSLAARRENGRTLKPAIKRDPSGLPLSVNGAVLHYGPNRRPLNVTRQGTTLTSYRYNAFGQRIAAIRADGRTDYFYLDNKVVAEWRRPVKAQAVRDAPQDTGPSAAPAITRRYVYAGHVPVGLIDYDADRAGAPGQARATLYAVHADLLGAPRAVTDAGRAIRWLAAYTPTGAATRIAGDLTLDARLPGQMFDAATGWHDNLLRTYSPELGQYLEPDPLGPVPGNQAFGYAGQRPRRHVDPLGLLLFAFDGTRSSAQTRTNVWKISQMYQDGPVFYQAGPGSPQALDWDAMTAYSAPDILDAQWDALLQALDQPGPSDGTIPIDIIGFSRGAALARHFANQIDSYVVNGYFSYADAQRGTITACVDLRFMGLFDTVAQFGLLGAQDANYDLSIASAWEWVAHAVALHERRWLFPLVSAGALGGNIVEAPFIGAHADIGGGIFVDADGQAGSRGDLSDVALNWMLWQARAASVRLADGTEDDRQITVPILHDERAPLLRSAQNGDRRVNAPDGSKLLDYQDDHARLGRAARDATEAFITRIDNWRRSDTADVGYVDMDGYADWLRDELGWQAPGARVAAS